MGLLSASNSSRSSDEEEMDAEVPEGIGKIGDEKGWISLGPWPKQGDSGSSWAYKPEGPMMSITIRYYYGVIWKITFKSKNRDGATVGSPVHVGYASGNDGTKKKFCIDSSIEQLSFISLAYEERYDSHRDAPRITSLYLETNIGNKYGPFGSSSTCPNGPYSVSIPVQGGVITGFHGLCRIYEVGGIGVFVAPKANSLPSSGKKEDILHPIQDPNSAPIQRKDKIINEEGLISFGPWGGENGVDWAFKASGPILQMSIRHGEVIDSILFQSRSCDGFVIGSSEKIGGSGGNITETFCIDSSVEQLWSINLTYGDYNGEAAIFSLCFCTNLKKYGPFGSRSGASYSVSIPMLGGFLVGFHGQCGTYLSAIGMIVTPKVNSLPSSAECYYNMRSIIAPDYAPTQLKGKIPGEEGLKSLGPWGASESVYWAYMVNAPIMRITIGYGSYIQSISCEGKSFDDIFIGCSVGDADAKKTETFHLDTSKEQLISISLTYKANRIVSICFDSNVKKYGPFGTEIGPSCEYIPLEGGVLRGFFGHLNIDYDGPVNSPTTIAGIGIFVGLKFPSVHSIQDKDSAPTEQKGMITNEEGWTSLGPWGEGYGFAWAYKVNSPVMHISICYGKTHIESIMCEGRGYDGIVIGGSGKICSSGGDGSSLSDGNWTETFCIDTSQEQFTSISLTYGNDGIESLCFDTNLMRYGPFGLETGASAVKIPLQGRVFRGFFGRSWVHQNITAIGIFVGPESNSLHAVQDPDSGPTLFKVKPGMLGIPTSKSKWSLQYLIPKLKANFCGSKPQKLENVILQDGASSSGTTKKDEHHGGTPSPSSEMIHKDLQHVGSSYQNMQKSEDNQHGGARSPTSELIDRNLILLDKFFEQTGQSKRWMKVEINRAHEKFKQLQILQTTEDRRRVNFDKEKLRKAIAMLQVQFWSHEKNRPANPDVRHLSWDNINGTNDEMMYLFYKEPDVEHTSDCGGIVNAFHALPQPLRDCLLCLFYFPPTVPIKRTPIIYLWIAQGYVSQSEASMCDVEEHAGNIFDELIAKGFIEPIYRKCSLEPDSCLMRPSVRSSLYKEAECRGFTSNGNLDLDTTSLCVDGDDLRGNSYLVNVGEAILNFDPEVFKNMKHIRSLYLGRWQSSVTHHIELTDAKILHGLNELNNLTFLSLRGISMIIELPQSISELKKLMILDLRACYNLEVIPENIGLLKHLTHLDMSECYYLENMPRSLAELSNLQVLKGFLIGEINNNTQPGTPEYLFEMQKLRKLNIRISVEDPLRLQNLEYIGRFEGLKKLTISWVGLQARAKDNAEPLPFTTIPPRLQKLVLQCFPLRTLSNWLTPGKLKELKKLYIRGGQLLDLGEILKCQEEKWNVEILRLDYLSEVELYWGELRTAFPKLIYFHQAECPKFMNFPCNDKGVWVNKMELTTHVQLQKYVKTIKTSRFISSSSMQKNVES